MKSPLLILASCFALGIFLARAEHRSSGEIIQSVEILIVMAGLCLVFGLVFLRTKWWQISFLLVLAGFSVAGAATAFLFEARFPPNHVRRLASMGIDLADPVRLEGVLVSTPYRTTYGLQFDVEAKRIEVGSFEKPDQTHLLTGKISAQMEASEDPAVWADIDSLRLQHGDTIRALVRLRRPRTYENPGSFDLRHWMESIEDVYWVGTIKSPLLVEKLPRAGGPSLAHFLEKTRHHFIDAIDNLYPPWSSEMRDGAVLKAILFGERGSLDSDTIENFRRTGLYHLLVIAGLHIGLLVLIANFLLRLLHLGEAWRSALVLIFLVVYTSLVEQRAPTLRASLMILAYLIARLLYREHAALNAIGLAALILLLIRPSWLWESGFELSFAATLLIAGLAVPILMRTTDPYRRALGRIDEVDIDTVFEPQQAQFRLDVRGMIAALKSRVIFLRRHSAFASAAVTTPLRMALWTANILLFSAILQLGLLLPMAEIFHRVTIAGIGLNTLAIPLMILILAFAVPTVILGAIAPALAVWPTKLVTLILSGLFALTDWRGLPNWLSFRVAEPPSWVAWGFVFSTVIAALALSRRARMLWVSLASLLVFAMLISLHPFAPRLPRGVLEVTALDCGGGDALFLVFPDQTTLLMDAGGTRSRNSHEGTFQGRRWDPGEDIVSPYLWSRGIKKIDIVVLSHAHADHLDGLAAVIRNFRVDEFWHGTNPATPPYQDLLDQVRGRGIPIREITAGDRVSRGATTVLTLWPPADKNSIASSHPSTNDDSLVLRISSGEASVLLPGDISGKVEHELLRSDFPLKTRTLKVGHHGSKTSSTSEFLGRLSPRVALVSAQGGGRIDLPSAETLGRLRAAGAQVFRTDIDGAITVEMQGKSISVHTFLTSPAD